MAAQEQGLLGSSSYSIRQKQRARRSAAFCFSALCPQQSPRHPCFPHRRIESSEPRAYNVNYQADGYDNDCRLAARLPRLFTMFQRFHSHVEGTGIGLFVVKHMVENAGGHIEVRSTLGEGAAFFVCLPHAPGGGAAA